MQLKTNKKQDTVPNSKHLSSLWLRMEINFKCLPPVTFPLFLLPIPEYGFCALSLFPGAGEAEEIAPQRAVEEKQPRWEESFLLGKVDAEMFHTD